MSELSFEAKLARFLEVDLSTLQRWLSGQEPIPRTVEIIMEILGHWPEVTIEAVDEIIAKRDAAEPRH
jgi:hypothetical protein